MMPSNSELLQRDGVSLVLGLEWFPLLGEHLQSQAKALARRRRASHYVIATGGAASVGLLRATAGRRKRVRACSAAAVFAALHPVGTVAAMLPLQDGRQWLVAVHEGAVMTRADQLHDGHASASDTIALLRDAYPGLVVRDEGHDSSALLDALFKSARDLGGLQRVPWLAPRRAMVLLAAALALAGALAIPSVRQRLPGFEKPVDVSMVDPVAAWQAAVAASARPHSVHGVAGLRAVLDSLYAVPVFMAGWQLAGLECRPGNGQWQCHANYRREGAGDNQGLIDTALPEWALSFDPMEGAVAAWAVALPGQRLTDVHLHGAARNEARLFSTLQAMLPAFADFRLDAPQPLPVAAPLDAQQRPVPRPTGIAGYQRRAVHLQAPLRSLSVLLPETMHMSWERIAVQLAAVDEPTLRSSSLRVSLSGVLYEKNDDTHHASSSPAAGAGSSRRLDDGPRRG